MAEIKQEPLRRAGHYIVSEAPGWRSRDQAMLAAGAGVCVAGTVLGRVSASGDYAPLDPDAADGTETAAAILYEERDAADTAQRCVVTARDAEVHAAVLDWPAGATDAEIETALVELLARGIVARRRRRRRRRACAGLGRPRQGRASPSKPAERSGLMALVVDVWRGNGWEVVDLQERVVERVEHKPQLLGQLGIFTPTYPLSPYIAISDSDRTLSLIPTSEFGAPPAELVPEGARVRPFRVNRIAKGSTVMAHELASILTTPFGQQVKTVAGEVARRAARIIDDVELTHEHMRLGAIQGKVIDADGTTVLVDWFEEWGIAEPAEINFRLTADTTNVRGKFRELKRKMQVAAKGMWTPTTRVGGLVGDAFFDAVLNHPQIKETKLYNDRAAAMEGIEGYGSFEVEGVTLINYQGSDPGAAHDLSIGTDKARFFPIGASDVFEAAYGPAVEFTEYQGQPGQEYFSMLLENVDAQGNPDARKRGDRVEIYSYPLMICRRPEMLLRGKRA